jgi:signal transduction histidine kinase
MESEGPELPIHTSWSVPDDIFVLVNPEHTKEALLNLINNAVRAMSKKPGGELRLSASIISGKKRARLVIEDTGVGMTKEESDSALKGFFEREGHTGVGVLISSVLLNVQGGTFEFDSTKGVGTKAIITLPLE